MKYTYGDIYNKGGVFTAISNCTVPNSSTVIKNVKLNQWIKPLVEQVLEAKKPIDKKHKFGEVIKSDLNEVYYFGGDKKDVGKFSELLKAYIDELNILFKEEVESKPPKINFTEDDFKNSDVKGNLIITLIDLGFMTV